MFSTKPLSKKRLSGTKKRFSPITKNDSFGKPVSYFSRDDSYKLNDLIIIFDLHVLNHTIILKPINWHKKSVFTVNKKIFFWETGLPLTRFRFGYPITAVMTVII